MDKIYFEKLLRSHSRTEISRLLGISLRTLDRKLSAFGLTRAKKQELSTSEVEQIRFLYEFKNVRQQDLAKQFKVTQATISQVVNMIIHKPAYPKITGSASTDLGDCHGN